MSERINKLVQAIHIVESEIKRLEEVAELEKMRDELKMLMVEEGEDSVTIGNAKAILMSFPGRFKYDIKKAEKLLHRNTFNAIFKKGKPYKALKVSTIEESDE